MPGAMFRDLACAAGDDVLVALPAALRVVGGSEASSILSTSSKMNRLSLKERRATTFSSFNDSYSGPWGSNPFVRLSKPAAASDVLLSAAELSSSSASPFFETRWRRFSSRCWGEHLTPPWP